MFLKTVYIFRLEKKWCSIFCLFNYIKYLLSKKNTYVLSFNPILCKIDRKLGKSKTDACFFQDYEKDIQVKNNFYYIFKQYKLLSIFKTWFVNHTKPKRVIYIISILQYSHEFEALVPILILSQFRIQVRNCQMSDSC